MMTIDSETISLAGAVVALFGVLVTVTKLLLKEKDSKIKMLQDFYTSTSSSKKSDEEEKK